MASLVLGTPDSSQSTVGNGGMNLFSQLSVGFWGVAATSSVFARLASRFPAHSTQRFLFLPPPQSPPVRREGALPTSSVQLDAPRLQKFVKPQNRRKRNSVGNSCPSNIWSYARLVEGLSSLGPPSFATCEHLQQELGRRNDFGRHSPKILMSWGSPTTKFESPESQWSPIVPHLFTSSFGYDAMPVLVDRVRSAWRGRPADARQKYGMGMARNRNSR